MARSATSTAPAAARKRGTYAKTAETREKILAAARDVAALEGLHGVSLSAVARRAGVAIGNVSYHFGSREELLRAIMQSVADELHENVVLASIEGRDVFERGESGVRAYLDFVHRQPSYVQMAEQVRHHHPELYRRNLAAWLDFHRDAIRRGIGEGTLRAMTGAEIDATAYFIVGAHYFLDQMIEGIDGNDYPGDDVVVDAFLALLRGGLARHGARKAKPKERER